MRGTSFTTQYLYNPTLPPNPESGVVPLSDVGYMPQEYQRSTYDFSGSLLKTTTKKWTTSNLMSAQCETLSDGSTGGSFYQYQPYTWASNTPNGNTAAQWTTLPIDVAQYDYGSVSSSCVQPGSLPLKDTQTAYWQQPSQPPTPLFSEGSSLLDRPSSVKVFGPVNNSKTLLSETDFSYDGANVTAVSPAPIGHDSSYSVSASTQLPRGNATLITRKCFPACSDQTFLYTYDETGQITLATDPRGNSTQYFYTDSYSSDNGSPSGNTNAYITKIIKPTVNGITFTDFFTYGFNDGVLRSTTDENNQKTTVCVKTGGCGGSSFDPWYRVTEVDYPDHGQTTASYSDAGPNPSTTISTAMGSGMLTTKTVMDARGRPVQTQLVTDPQGTNYADTVYDGLGLVYKSSNPYRSSSDPTYGLTTSTYDALGRPTSVVAPDSGTSTWLYPGKVITVSDPAGAHWNRTTNFLGELTNVAELGTSSSPLNLQTAYTYDGLGNLTSALQYGASGETARSRSFSYNSLSQLFLSNNPETGYICYGAVTSGAPTASNCTAGYDLNGNLLHKVDARSIRTDYTYDALNRLTLKSYSDGTNVSAFGYDGLNYKGTPLSSLGFQSLLSVGRLSEISNVGNSAVIYSHDPMGRVISAQQYLQSSNDWSTKSVAVFDVAGDLTDLTYPDGRHLKQTWNGAGRLLHVDLVDIHGVSTSQSYLQSANQAGNYFPDGSPSLVTLGNGIQESIQKNNRLQVQSLIASEALNGETFLLVNYCFYNTGCTSGSPSSGANNGNIWNITDNLNGLRSQSFVYDGLNRLSAVKIGANHPQQYSIDSFGNMSTATTQTIAQSNGTTSTVLVPDFTFDPATNRVKNLPCAGSVSPAFDAAGDQLCDNDSNNAVRVYGYNGDSQIKQIAMFGNTGSPFETYAYLADARVRKSNADGTFTEYVDFNGQPIAEKGQTGLWTDYIYANGQRIAMVKPSDQRYHLTGTYLATTDSNRWTVGQVAFPASLMIRAGDVLSYRIYQHNANAGISIGFTDGSNSDWYCGICKGPVGQSDAWVNVSVALGGSAASPGPMVGKTFTYFQLGNFQGGPNGEFDVMMADLALSRSDGSVVQFPVAQGTGSWGGDTPNESGTSFVGETVLSNSGRVGAINPTRFYLGDHLGSAQMEFTAGGWPMSSTQFAPFGAELSTSTTSANHYKFTGKERDGESGNDYFGGRYYASTMGRFMSPDWAAKVEPVPYAKLDDPQSLNLYAYVGNNPLSRTDADGHTQRDAWNWHDDLTAFYHRDLSLNSSGASAYEVAAEGKYLAQVAEGSGAQQQTNPTAAVNGKTVTYTYPDGSKVALSGTHPFRDNNPGDLRSGHGSIGRDGGFAIYPSLDAGVNALGATLTGKYGNSSIVDTMKSFAPGSDGNDPVKYAATLASAVGVPVSTRISALSPAQLMTFQYNIAIAEGYNSAGNTATYSAPPQ